MRLIYFFIKYFVIFKKNKEKTLLKLNNNRNKYKNMKLIVEMNLLKINNFFEIVNKIKMQIIIII